MFRSRHSSVCEVGAGPSGASGVSNVTSGRVRHMSMQDRVEMYNTVLALEDEEEDMEQTQVRTRKSSKVNTSH